ncbi:MAG: hypothetical protein KIS92_13155 [Planctomycetota bacterium]|nr:hypothetical protein [Planctomycetota bacterium]
MNCEDLRLALEDSEDAARLPEPARAHLASCAECSEYASLVEPGSAALRQALSQPPDAQAWARVKAGLNAKLDKRARAPRAAAQPAPFWTPFRLAVGAAAAVLLGLAVYLARPEPRELPVAKDDEPSAPPAELNNQAARERLARLQDEVRAQLLLEEVAVLEGALEEHPDPSAKSTAQDAELYVERLLALKGVDPNYAREVLAGIRRAQISQRLQDVKKKLGDQAGETVTRPLDRLVAALGEAEKIADLEGGQDANAN